MKWLVGEPALEDMLSDPVVQAVMRRDGVDVNGLRDFLRRLRAARTLREGASRKMELV